MIGGGHYLNRRCRTCLYQGAPESLPELNKKVIYIDQFAISNMMKAINPKTRAYQKGSLDPFYYDLFQVLYKLCKMQQLVCPTSFFHTRESLSSPFFGPLKEFCKLLSEGVKFHNSHTIQRFQLVQHARNWIKGNPDKSLQLNLRSVVSGDINSWPPDFRIQFNLNYGPEVVQDLIRWRDSSHAGLAEIFERWRGEKDRRFEDWFHEESMSFGEILYRNYVSFSLSLEKVATVYSVKRSFEEAGVSNEELGRKVFEYFHAPELKEVPCVKMLSMLYAAMARKAVAGQKRPPSRGMGVDVEAISVLLPYCDAMLIDKECHAYLKEAPLCDSLDYGTLVFSLNNREELMEYLENIERAVSEDFRRTLTDLYGNWWQEPLEVLPAS